MQVDELTKFKKRDGLRIRKQVDDYTIFNTKTARFFVTNEIGHYILNQLDGEKTVSDLVDHLYQECVDKPQIEEIRQDVDELIVKLLEYEMLDSVS